MTVGGMGFIPERLLMMMMMMIPGVGKGPSLVSRTGPCQVPTMASLRLYIHHARYHMAIPSSVPSLRLLIHNKQEEVHPPKVMI